MDNKIGLTWEFIAGMAIDLLQVCESLEETKKLASIVSYCKGKSGEIPIVEETVSQFQVVGREEFSKNYPEIDGKESKCMHICYECYEHAKLYEGAEEL